VVAYELVEDHVMAKAVQSDQIGEISQPLDMNERLPLTGGSLSLTALSDGDIGDLLPFFQDVSVLRYYLPTTVRPLNEHQLRQLLKEWQDGESYFVFVIRKDNQAVGLVNIDGLDYPNSHAEVGIAITDRLQRGQGLAREALELLLDFAFGELNLNRIWCRVISGNEPSIRLFTQSGFRQEGILRRHVRRSGAFRDMLVFGLLRDERPARG
jgi:RimJ/RimL family protein N-acetyltransferase